MNGLATTKRQQDLNIHLSNILHQYLLCVDALHGNALADIEDNLSTIQSAVFACRHIMIDYKISHLGGDK